MTRKTYSYIKHLHFEADVRDKRPNLNPAWAAQTCGGGGSQNPRKSIADETHMHRGKRGNRRWDTIPPGFMHPTFPWLIASATPLDGFCTSKRRTAYPNTGLRAQVTIF